MNPPLLLSVKDLNVYFKVDKKQIHAVQGISFSLYPNEILGVVGESGSGKSAMAKALLGLLPKHSTSCSGTVLFKEKNLIHSSERELQRIRGKEIGMIFQDPMTSLNPTMKIGYQIIEGYLFHNPHTKKKEAYDYALYLLELVGIPDPHTCIDDYPHTLSGGMRQRAMIAIALSTKPYVIIADEPTTALDVTIQAQILDLMKKIKETTKTSLIFITHDLSVIAGYCDRVMVMYSGQIIEKAKVEDLFAQPSHPYTKGLLQSIPRLDLPKNERLIPIPGSPPTLTEEFIGCPFFKRCQSSLPICCKERPELKGENEHKIACFHWEKNESAS